MKSLRTKILVLVLSFVILSSLAIGITSFYNAKQAMQKDSVTIMNLLSESKSESFNEIFKRVKQSVETLSVYARQDIEQADNFKTQEAVDAFSKKILPTALDAANNTDAALSVYIRFDPSFVSGTSGFFYVKDENEQFQAFEPTDLEKYDESKAEHTSWFYIPKKTGKPLWMNPYYNKNIEQKMISYVVPLYLEDDFIGIVGMDIDFDKLSQIVANTKLYKSGYAFLTDSDANLVYHKELEVGVNLIDYNNGEFANMANMLLEDSKEDVDLISYTYDGVKKEAAFRSLENGMRFIVTAPRSEIESEANKILIDILFRAVIIISIASILSILYTKRLVRPLQELTSVARKIASGDMDVSIEHHSKDEVGVLADSFRLTIMHLSKYFKSIQELAYKDALTGVQNTRAYKERMIRLNQKIKNNEAEFFLIVFDLNDLKQINDTYGHTSGDLFIVSASRILCDVFDHFPVYRIGGDEFVVILEDIKKEKCKHLIRLFEKSILQQNREKKYQLAENLWLAWGVAIFNEESDQSVQDVFKRADKEMYMCKINLKNKKG